MTSSSPDDVESRRKTSDGSDIVLSAEVRDQLVALQVPQRVLQLHELDEQIVFWIHALGVRRALPVEGKPLLDAAHAGPPGQVEEQREVEDDRRREDRVTAEEVDLDLHRV